MDGEDIELDIVDTAGLDEFRMVREQRMKDREGFIVVYDSSNAENFERIDWIFDWIYAFHPIEKMVPVVLVANKVDKVDRIVSYEEGENKARMTGS